MSWLETLAAELRARGVPARERRRILLELHDHIDCEPGCEDRLGAPRELAASFADELATARTRSGALRAFGALSLAAAALAISQLAIGTAGGHPGFSNGISLWLFFPALIGMFFAPQIALVAGTLAALRAVRRRGVAGLPAAELGLIGRRARVALLAGFATVAGLELYVIDFSQRLPAWYLGLVGGLATVAGAALCATLRGLTSAQAIVSTMPGTAGDVYDDLPLLGRHWLRRSPRRLGVVAALVVGGATTLFFAHAESSLQEGLERGVVEGLAAATGFALLGRAVGLIPARSEQRGLSPHAPAGFEHRLASDDDRALAAHALRDGFAAGQLKIEELGSRLSAVHTAETVGQLRDALRGLRD
jgi:hypothetical protein